MASMPDIQTVYRIEVAEDFAGLVLVEDRDLDALGEFRGEPRAATWAPVRMRWEDEGRYPVPDIAYVLGALVLSQRARDVLDDLLDGRGEFLPVEVVGGEPVWLFNLTRLSDALDAEATEFRYFRSGRIMDIERPVFDTDKLDGETVFRVREVPEVYEYATERFKHAVEGAALSGLRFVAV